MLQAGGRAYLVGGGVRDHLLGRGCKDFDVEVFGLDVDALTSLLERCGGSVNAVGRSFGVLKWRPRDLDEEVDVSIPRRDSKVGRGHKGIAVEGDPTMSIEEAARRRDLTINAIMYDLVDERIVDPHGGRADLEAGVLRAVDATTFLEDPLRALRVVQFAARTGFTVSPDLVELCRIAPLDELPAERVQGEWLKLLLKGDALTHGLRVARDAEVLRRVFPEVAELDTDAVCQVLVLHRDHLEPMGRRAALMLLGWLHPAEREALERTLDRLAIHTLLGYATREQVLRGHAAWGRPTSSDADLRHLSAVAEVELTAIATCVAAGMDPAPVLARAAALGVLHGPPAAFVLGRDLVKLGVRPGPDMGRWLDRVYEQQLDGAVSSKEEALAWITPQL
ncbi:MAG: CCA tRNA nucleotidyltransferase [Alphaproteobacteria bacterium]|nr:CCA tRNA nucleotidyltransferase [Alphaproteobacteria bacterium]